MHLSYLSLHLLPIDGYIQELNTPILYQGKRQSFSNICDADLLICSHLKWCSEWDYSPFILAYTKLEILPHKLPVIFVSGTAFVSILNISPWNQY